MVKVGRIWGTQNETKKQPPTERLHFTCGQLQLLKQLQPAKLRDASDGVCQGVACRMRQTAVGGSQKRLARCFRELEVATQQHENS